VFDRENRHGAGLDEAESQPPGTGEQVNKCAAGRAGYGHGWLALTPEQLFLTHHSALPMQSKHNILGGRLNVIRTGVRSQMFSSPSGVLGGALPSA
jgi:hypothetical protein